MGFFSMKESFSGEGQTGEAPTGDDKRGRIVRSLAAGALIALHLPFLFWLRDLWFGLGVGGSAASAITPIITLGLLYLRRHELKGLAQPQDKFSPPGAGIMLAGVALALTAIFRDEIIWMALSVPICLHGYWTWTRGHERVQFIILPIYALIFLVPGTYGELHEVSFFLQTASAQVATWMLQVSTLPSALEGVIITTGITTNHVTEECSGMSTMSALLLYGMVSGYIFRLNFRNVVSLIGLLLPAALLANGARVAVISALLYFYGEEVANGPWHNGSGYILFGMTYISLFGIMRLLKTRQERNASRKNTTQPLPI